MIDADANAAAICLFFNYDWFPGHGLHACSDILATQHWGDHAVWVRARSWIASHALRI